MGRIPIFGVMTFSASGVWMVVVPGAIVKEILDSENNQNLMFGCCSECCSR